MTERHGDRAHALISASGASRWLNCTPSPRLEENFEEQESDFAAEGTLAHEFASLELERKSGKIKLPKYNARLKLLRGHKLYTQEMEGEVEKYVVYVLERFAIAKKETSYAELLIEEKIDLRRYIEDGFGTGDTIIITDKIMEVIDLKYGKGVRVSAVDNPQLMLYGIGAYRAASLMYDIESVKLTIHQPRLDHVSAYEISVDELRKWAIEVVIPRAKLAYTGEGFLCAGDWCRWCKAKVRCRALAEKNIAIAKHDFADPALMNDVELLEVFKQIGGLTNWANSVSDYVFKEALSGKNWEGYKLVAGKSNRVWSNEDAIKSELSKNYKEAEYLNVKLKGIGDIEKLVKKANFDKLLGAYVNKPAGKPTLVEESDKRPALSNAKDDFSEQVQGVEDLY